MHCPRPAAALLAAVLTGLLLLSGAGAAPVPPRPAPRTAKSSRKLPPPARAGTAATKPAAPPRQKPAAKPAPPPASPSPAVVVRSAPAAPSSSWWESANVEIVAAGKARINYEAGVVKATGLAALAPPTLSRSRAQDTLDAREAAVADALRILAMAVSRVRVTAATRVENYLLKSDDVKVRVDGVVRSAHVIEEALSPSSIYRVVVQVPLAGEGSISEALGLGNPGEGSPGGKEQAEEAEEEGIRPGGPPPPGATYTGLIVDCRGLRVVASMSPKLYGADGAEVYGTMKVSPDFVIETGIVGYPRSMEEARRSARVGDRPLIVQAARCLDRHRCFPVLSKGEAEKIRAANAADKFLERTAVVFVVDPL